ncbi:hypothetical protein M3212_03055 [Alkalihalobacillus oceani]|uniref:hypothetical protein n=1 Tax=Halalkalibacter oceani TaxID=1653776 RepID=UPI00203AC201|nr:hypothetical protein [Halalkalibacter oceani]MCM3759762.1 hypothetical protein [Halalkalibacter oceani]
MAIYRPVKKILIPIMALLVGSGAAYFLMPTKMDAIWRDWNAQSEEWEQAVYQVASSYEKDGAAATEERGIWSKERSFFEVTAAVSNDSFFTFDAHFEGDRLFVQSGDKWVQGTTSDRFVAEFSPLDHPFQWMRDMLLEAEEVRRESEDGRTVYQAVFTEFDESDFRGYSLERQEETTLTLTVADDQLLMEFAAKPIRPDYLGPFSGYPQQIGFELSLEKVDEQPPPVPAEAYDSEQLE